MKFRIKYFSFIFFLFVACSSDVDNNKISNSGLMLKNRIDTISYSLGVVVGNQMKKYGISSIKFELFVSGLKQSIKSEQTQIPDELAGLIVNKFVLSTYSKKVLEDTKKSLEFEKQLKSNSNVIILNSGLQYKIIKSGKGKKPSLNSVVYVYFRGKLLDGTEFSNNFGQQPAKFVVRNSIKGWQEALLMMKEGDMWELYIPPNLAFGSKGTSKVPPNETVIYTLELLKIE